MRDSDVIMAIIVSGNVIAAAVVIAAKVLGLESR